jgi:hypothetical protein
VRLFLGCLNKEQCEAARWALIEMGLDPETLTSSEQ